jgi:mannonate dehydratase
MSSMRNSSTQGTPAVAHGRRRFLRALCAGAAAAIAGCDLDLREGMRNACARHVPPSLAHHPLVVDAWKGIEPADVWDMHCHVFGNGDSGLGPWFNPAMTSLLRPAQLVQRRSFMNAACVHDIPGQVDSGIVDRLLEQCDGLPRGTKVVLLAFDWARDEQGAPVEDRSIFFVPDRYVADLARRHPDRFEWAASIHPHAPDALSRLDDALAKGARAIKWLPPAQLIDPASPRCDAFYKAMAAARIPLLSHAGDERAVRGGVEAFGNPLLLRRALDAGVRVIVAHCGSLGMGRDLDARATPPLVRNFDLFARLMDSGAYKGLLFADISALTQANRLDVLGSVLERRDWHPRLLNGSDYPLPGIPPLISLGGLVDRGLLPTEAVEPLRTLRDHNALLFDFVLKRSVASAGHRFERSIFATRAFLSPSD